jgi:regulator of replication initiation timing
MAGLVAAERHARRQDKSKHIDRSRTHLNLAEGYEGVDDPLAIRDAYKARKKDTGATERKGVAVAVHMLLGVSPDWIAAAGDVHDPANPRNKALFDSARAFMEERFGKGAVIHVRLDVDEAGSGVVDVIAVPTTTYTQRGKTKTRVSANAGLEAAFGQGLNYRQMQDAWAEHCQQTLDPAIERGQSIEETGRAHVHHSIFRPAQAEANEIKARARAQAVREWGNAKDWPWRDREKIVDAAIEEGARRGGAVVRKKAIAAMKQQRAKADEEWRGKINTLETEVEVAREHLRETVEERDQMAVEVDALRLENGKLKREVSGLKRIVETIYKNAPAPVKRIIDALRREQKAPAPIGTGVGLGDPGSRTPSPF